MKIRKFAAIDIGSNAVRLLVSNVINFEGKIIFQKNSFVRVPIRLGQDTFSNGEISKKKYKTNYKINEGLPNAYENSWRRKASSICNFCSSRC